MVKEPVITREGGVLRINGLTFEEWRAKNRQMYREMLAEDLKKMKRILEGMAVVGQTNEMLEEYRWLASSCRSWKRLIKNNK